MATKVDEERASLWSLAVPPIVWAAHFLLSYLTAAIWCAKFAGAERSLSGARVLIAAYTAAALAALFMTGLRGYLQQRHGEAQPPHDADTPEDRYRFMGYAALLLSGLSAIAVAYAALVVVFVRSCH